MFYELIKLEGAFNKDNEFDTINAIVKGAMPQTDDEELNIILKMYFIPHLNNKLYSFIYI